ncbi:MAG: VRR-NUC domain-containing protein [Spirochaetaceae bacterium]|nr:VRR-NUC domain-containing protein [Spirochaetaceae bacterium]
MKEKGKLESAVLKDCLRVLRNHNVFCWRQNTGAFKVEKRFFRSSIAGVSDILGVLPDGRFIAVECKREIGGVLSERQLAFLSNVQNNKGLAFIAHSGKELAALLKATGYSERSFFKSEGGFELC